MRDPFARFRYMTFDVVGTLIDFEQGLVSGLGEIAREHGVDLNEEQALALYRAARAEPDALRFPDDLARVYLRIAPELGLPASESAGERLRDGAANWKPFADSVEALAVLGRSCRLIAMTNAQRWAFTHFDKALGSPFHASFTTDDTGTEKPDPAFFHKVLAFIEEEGGSPADVLHVAQSQYHDIGVSRALGLTNCWIERRSGKSAHGGTIAAREHTVPDFHFTSMADFARAVTKETA